MRTAIDQNWESHIRTQHRRNRLPSILAVYTRGLPIAAWHCHEGTTLQKSLLGRLGSCLKFKVLDDTIDGTTTPRFGALPVDLQTNDCWDDSSQSLSALTWREDSSRTDRATVDVHRYPTGQSGRPEATWHFHLLLSMRR